MVVSQLAQAAYLLRNSLSVGAAFAWTDVPRYSRTSPENQDLVDKFLTGWQAKPRAESLGPRSARR